MFADGQTVEDVAKRAGVSVRLMYQALALQRSGCEDLLQEVRDGRLTLNAAMLQAGLIRQRSKFDRLVTAWNACSDAERTQLLISAGVWPADLQS